MLTRRFKDAKAKRVLSDETLKSIEASSNPQRLAEWKALEAKARNGRLDNLDLMMAYEVTMKKGEQTDWHLWLILIGRIQHQESKRSSCCCSAQRQSKRCHPEPSPGSLKGSPCRSSSMLMRTIVMADVLI